MGFFRRCAAVNNRTVGEALYRGVGSLADRQAGPDARLAGVAAWSLVHGFATLWLTGALPAGLGGDPETAARAVAGILFRAP